MDQRKIQSNRDVESFYQDNSENRFEDELLRNVNLQNPTEQNEVQYFFDDEIEFDSNNEVEIPFINEEVDHVVLQNNENILHPSTSQIVQNVNNDHNYTNRVSASVEPIFSFSVVLNIFEITSNRSI